VTSIELKESGQAAGPLAPTKSVSPSRPTATVESSCPDPRINIAVMRSCLAQLQA
jgi:hypothetical protein